MGTPSVGGWMTSSRSSRSKVGPETPYHLERLRGTSTSAEGIPALAGGLIHVMAAWWVSWHNHLTVAASRDNVGSSRE